MKRTVIGILAHVDAGKTTLSEAMLYCTGAIRSLGRVDHGDAFLDNFTLERKRGITIFSKQAVLELPGLKATLLDTPGHVDFSAEMERTLDVLDCAILVVSAPAGVQSHTRTVWRLLRRHGIPTLVFVNKMDRPDTDRVEILGELCRELGDGFFDFDDFDAESLALCDEALLESFIASGALERSAVIEAVRRGSIFPCWFGAALRLDGVEELLRGLELCAPEVPGRENFAARVFKITHDEQGASLAHMKITGGALHSRDVISCAGREQKVTQLRVYSGAKFTPVDEALPGDIVTVPGLEGARPGMGLGAEDDGLTPSIESVLTYSVIFPEKCDIHRALLQLEQLREEDPQLNFIWDERTHCLNAQLMGPVQLEVLRELARERFGLEIGFGPGNIIYRETIAAPVEGVGHYEPLRHYAEVHLLLSPGERGSGLHFASDCSEDELDRNWQRLILTHLQEKQHLGVLTGSPVTDMKITLVSGRAHEKHTEGGDFRQATYRAVRQGLMRAESILLEPWYDFIMEMPQESVGRAMTDLQRMGARLDAPESAGGDAVLRGSAPVAKLREYPSELASYTHGLGRFSCEMRGYEPCPEQAEIVAAAGYDPEADVDNTPDSVFCAHGAGYNVKWSQVPEHMHLPSVLEPAREEGSLREQAARYCEYAASDKELMAIFERTYGPVKDRARAMRPTERSEPKPRPWKAAPQPEGPEYILVDGYNIIFAWDELKKMAQTSLDSARSRLIEILRNFQGFRRTPVILVFDAYKVKNGLGSVEKYGDFTVVYTKEAETADMYIEKATYELGKKHRVRVATSDGLEQVIILSHGALRVPALAFEAEVREAEDAIRGYLNGPVR